MNKHLAKLIGVVVGVLVFIKVFDEVDEEVNGWGMGLLYLVLFISWIGFLGGLLWRFGYL